MEIKKDFLEKVLRLFHLNGAKNTTMDDIARAFSISKKTLYQHYNNKEELLKDVLNYDLEILMEEMSLKHHKDDCPIKKMLCRDEKVDEMSKQGHTLFIRQLKRYYNEIYTSQVKKAVKGMSEILEHNIQRGREQGLYREDFNEKYWIRFMNLIILSFDESPVLEGIPTDKEEDKQYLIQEILLFYLHAITTEKGKQKIKEYINENKQH